MFNTMFIFNDLISHCLVFIYLICLFYFTKKNTNYIYIYQNYISKLYMILIFAMINIIKSINSIICKGRGFVGDEKLFG